MTNRWKQQEPDGQKPWFCPQTNNASLHLGGVASLPGWNPMTGDRSRGWLCFAWLIFTILTAIPPRRAKINDVSTRIMTYKDYLCKLFCLDFEERYCPPGTMRSGWRIFCTADFEIHCHQDYKTEKRNLF
jgi:hypothetical protein